MGDAQFQADRTLLLFQVLRGLGNPVLAEQRLQLRQKARERLQADLAQCQQQGHRIQAQRVVNQEKLDLVKTKLTRDSAFEKRQ